ncbi:MAG: hypothetical protein ACK4OF_01880 [Aquificaceae bacterium]
MKKQAFDSRLMLDVMVEAAPALAFIDSRREIIFSTKAFDELLGIKSICVKCQSILGGCFKNPISVIFC